MNITYYGHSCFSTQIGKYNILFDPFISENPLAEHIDIQSIDADYIFLSHGHFDHILDVQEIAARTSAVVVANFEITNWLAKNGVSNMLTLNPGGQKVFEFGSVKCVPAQHSSSFPDGSYAGTASGFVIKSDEGNFYYSGDAALSLDMQLVAKWAKLDFAVFPIGDALTMGAEEAIQASAFVGAEKVVGVHFDTFPQIQIDKEKALTAFREAGIELVLLNIGENRTL